MRVVNRSSYITFCLDFIVELHRLLACVRGFPSRYNCKELITGFNGWESEAGMEIGEMLAVHSRAEWRTWLAAHHQAKMEIWLVIYKSSSGKRELPLDQAVEEALCFGWVDSTLKPLDAESYALRFSPRRKKSHWAESNRARVLRLLREGKMTPAGMAVLPADLLSQWEAENPPQD